MKRLINLSFLLIILLSLASCLKDKDYVNGKLGHKVADQNIIELSWPSKFESETALALDIVNKDTSIKVIPVRLASGAVASQDITITLDTSITTTYIHDNIDDNPSLRYFTSSIGTLESGLTVTIPKGSNEGYIVVKTNSSNYNPAYQYALGYKITSVNPPGDYIVSSGLNSHVLLFSAKNKFDAHYNLTLTHTGWAAFGILDNTPTNWPNGLDLVTTGANTLGIYSSYTANILQPGVTPTGYTQFGNAAPLFTFDLATNKLLSVTNRIDDSPRGRNFAINPAAPSTHNVWNPATKNVTLNYFFIQPGRPDLSVIMELKYAGAR